MLVALYLHQSALRHSLRHVVVRPLEIPESELSLVHAMRAERERHIAHFGGREQVLAELAGLTGTSAGTNWVAVVATAGMGKSALAAAFTRACSAAAEGVGPGALATRFVAPWLPGCLLHLGKQCKSVLDATNGIVAQAAALLLEPLPRVSSGGSTSALELDWHADFDVRVDTGEDGRHEERGPRSRYAGSAHLRSRGSAVDDRCRAAIHSALGHLVDERGEALLVVDGLDEIPDFGNGHAWLPRELPPGSRAIVFSRDDAALARFLEERRGAHRVELGVLNRQEIADVLGINVADSAKFLDEVEAKTRGWPTEVAPLRVELEREGDPSRVKVRRRQESLKRLASMWAGEPTEQLLEVLAAFEPCGPLPVDALQGWLEFRSVPLRRPQVDTAIDRIADQVSGREGDQLRLALGPFGEYLRCTHYSKRDWRSIVVDVLRWVERDDTVTVKVAAAFLGAWSQEKGGPVAGIPNLRIALHECLSTPRGGDILWESEKRRWLERDAKDLSFSKRCWELGCAEAGGWVAWSLLTGKGGQSERVLGMQIMNEAAELSEKVRLRLANALVDGIGGIRDTDRGLKLLRQAAESNQDAKAGLGERLLDGRGVPRDGKAGLQLLREAADSSDDAKGRLGERLLDGKGMARDLETGLRLVREAALSDKDAKRRLGERLLGGICVRRDTAEGLRLLREAAESDPFAKNLLGHRLLEGNGLPRDPEEGLRLLREAATSQPFLKALLADQFFDGKGVPRNAAEGLRLLREAADSDDAKRRLGERFLDGNGLPRDADEGLRLLRDAAETDEYARKCLGERLLEGRGVAKDAEEGLRLLREAAEWHAIFKAELGERFLDGSSLRRDEAEGLKLLREAAESSEHAMQRLGERLLSGKGLPRNEEEGLRLLRDAAEIDKHAKRQLAVRLLDGNGLPKNEAEGLRLLREVAEFDEYAKQLLAERLLDGRGVPKNEEEGLRLLREAAEFNQYARQRLCERLLDGKGVAKDADEGLRLLREAAENNPLLTGELGERLLEGKGVPRDVDEGLKLLREAAEADPVSRARLGAQLFRGNNVTKDVEAGLRLLGESTASGRGTTYAADVAFKFFELGQAQEALAVFLAIFDASGDPVMGNNAAYILRRRLATAPQGCTPIPELLAPGVAENEPFSVVNHMLFEFMASPDHDAWTRADEAIAGVSDGKSIGEWWGKLVNDSDEPEGHLVLALLMRHHDIDGCGLTAIDHLAKLRTSGWLVPDWMTLPPEDDRS